MISHPAKGRVAAIHPRNAKNSRNFPHYEFHLDDQSRAYILDPDEYQYISDKTRTPADPAFIEFVKVRGEVEPIYIEWGKRKVVIKVVHDGLIYGCDFNQ